MKVLVVDRSTWGTTLPYPRIQEVNISDKCPKCSGPRGVPYGYNFVEDGQGFHCHKWDNPCGHIDMYEDVLKEYNESIQGGE